jgi:putative thioredoxin
MATNPTATAANPAQTSSGVTETTTATFRADVLEPSVRTPVLVEFWAPWCGPCRQLAPALERMAKAAAGKIKLVKMNIDEHPEIAAQLGVKSIPAVIAFQRGRPVDGFIGALPENQLKGFVERLAGPLEETSDAFLTAESLICEGDYESAEPILARLAEEDPPHVKAVAELARIYIETDRLEQARALIDALPLALRGDPSIAASVAALEIVTQASGLGEIEDLQKRVAFDPSDLQGRFELALALNAAGRREEASDALLDIIRWDRSWNDDGARKQLVQFFEAWGPMDKATVAGRRRLSALLFA